MLQLGLIEMLSVANWMGSGSLGYRPLLKCEGIPMGYLASGTGADAPSSQDPAAC